MSVTGPIRNTKRKACIVTGLVIVLLASLSRLPQYLIWADRPTKSDVIVLFGGVDSRLWEALQLLQDGYTGYLFIPVTFSLYKTGPGRGGITAIRFRDFKPGVDLPDPRPEEEMIDVYFRKNRAAYGFPWYYEATHVEMLLAKKAMDACGFKKAIFVSSPYHMRRIKIMSGRVFGPSYDIKLVPSHFETNNNSLQTSWIELHHTLTEFSKIIWFRCYELRSRYMPIKL